jgi:hypothetical protein
MGKMIVFDLLCSKGHRFEGWFNSAADYASQKERALVSCPSCGSGKVERVPSATRANLGAEPPKPAPQPPSNMLKTPDMDGKDPFAIAQMLYSKMLDEILTKTEDVGKEFAAEARKIHYEEVPARAIRGQATTEEHDALVDEGIPVARFPVPPTDKLS